MASELIDLEEWRRKSRMATDPFWSVAVCMYCGAEYPWGLRHDHRCVGSSKANHPANS